MNEVGQGIVRGIKEQLDPKNIFALNNTVDYHGMSDVHEGQKH